MITDVASSADESWPTDDPETMALIGEGKARQAEAAEKVATECKPTGLIDIEACKRGHSRPEHRAIYGPPMAWLEGKKP